MEQEITLTLSKEQALVLFEFLSRFNQDEHKEIFEDQSEEKMLWILEGQLQSILVEPFMPDYLDIILDARNKTRDEEN